ncbi:MAG: hypothetical protein BIFFINMI_03438 [Phycisphaerae bacterium]|nr:hypothetical protein [Phycisphaerae bacterium]
MTPLAAGRLVIERVLRADRETVFRCWTQPEHLFRWFAPTPGYATHIAEVDLRVGGRYRIGMRMGPGSPEYIVGGEYREIVPPARLVFTWQWETGGPGDKQTLVTVTLDEQGGGTRLVLTHENFDDAKARDTHAEGWSGCLDRLVELVEGL